MYNHISCYTSYGKIETYPSYFTCPASIHIYCLYTNNEYIYIHTHQAICDIELCLPAAPTALVFILSLVPEMSDHTYMGKHQHSHHSQHFTGSGRCHRKSHYQRPAGQRCSRASTTVRCKAAGILSEDRVSLNAGGNVP